MKTESKIKVSLGEIARTLGWNYEATVQIHRRKAPATKYQMIKECEKKLLKAKQEVQQEFQTY